MKENKEDTKLSFWESFACIAFPIVGAPMIAVLNNNNPKKAQEAILLGAMGIFVSTIVSNFIESKTINIG